MTTEQMFFATCGLMVTLFVAGIGFFKFYLDAKFEGMYKIIERLDRRDESLNAYSR